MADEPQTAAQDDEQGASIPGQEQDDSNPYAGQDLSGGAPVGPPQPQTSSTSTPSAATAPPKASGRAMFLGNLLKTILSGVQNAQGNPNNAFDRGFANNSPQANQKRELDMSKLQTEADTAKIQNSIMGLKLLQTKHMVDRLSQDDQERFTDMSDKYYKALRDDEGMEIQSYADDPKAAKADADQQNAKDQRVKDGLGVYQPITHYDEDGKRISSVVFFGTKDVLKHDVDLGPNPNYNPDKPEDDDTNPKEITLKAGIPQKGLPQAIAKANALAQGLTKEQHDSLMKLNGAKEDTPAEIEAKASQLKQWMDTEKDSTFKSHNLPSVKANIARLEARLPVARKEELDKIRAGVQIHKDAKDEEASKGAEMALNYADIYSKESPTGPGDEALMEKFFELAKPSTGFRMSQPQITMLANARSWMDSGEAKTRHATEGTWFSKDQRKQIIHTMHDLAQAKGAKGATAATPTRPPNVPANAVWNAETRQWRLPQ